MKQGGTAIQSSLTDFKRNLSGIFLWPASYRILAAGAGAYSQDYECRQQ